MPGGEQATPRSPGDDERAAPATGPAGAGGAAGTGATAGPARRAPRKQVLLRLDPQVYDALARWAGDELRSANAQIEFLLRRALAESGRLPSSPAPSPAAAAPEVVPE